MTFENQTGMDVSKLEIRYAEDADWMEISLEDDMWASSYQIPVSMAGQMPVAEDGWQVQMTFDDEESCVWEGVEFDDAEVITFSLTEDGDSLAEIGVEAPEDSIDTTDALTDDTTEE